MTDKELLQQALFWIKGVTLPATNELAEKISARLAQPEQGPVATVYDAYDTTGIDWHCKDAPATGTKLYTSPPQLKTEPEPVLWAAKESMFMWGKSDDHGHPYHIICKGQKVRSHQIPLYTAPQQRKPPTQDLSAPLTVNGVPMYPQREWQGLTDEEIKEIVGPWGDQPVKGYTRKLFDQIEAKLKEKNNAI